MAEVHVIPNRRPIPIRPSTSDKEPIPVKPNNEYTGIETYEGQYDVTPMIYSETVLETKDKKMLNDVTVEKVPVHKTRNSSGGYTIYVAESV